MSVTLGKILDLVGTLDDRVEDDTPRERFRKFLNDSVHDIGQIRDYLEECQRNKRLQYSRALQDLVNHLGSFLGFQVEFGRYSGIKGEIGYDGFWKSTETDFYLVVEVKASEVYPVKTATLTNYVDELISEGKIKNWDTALGLYVIGRPDPEIRQLENAIIAEKRTHQMRIISVESLLSLTEMMNEYDVGHKEILAVIRPSGPTIDSVVELMTRLVTGPPPIESEGYPSPGMVGEGAAAYWLTPVKSYEEETAEECIRKLVGEEMIYALGERTPGRSTLKPGDWICFYASGTGVVAHARVRSLPEKKPHPKIRHSDEYPWTFRLEKPNLHLSNPIVINAALRSQLDAFEGRDPDRAWGWFVQATRKISEHDFEILTRKMGGRDQ